jgi:hypothetical protein
MNPLGAVLGIVGQVLDRVIPDPQKKAEAALELMKMQQSGDLQTMAGQLEVNKVEAASPKTLVAGWRPACGWVCVGGLAYSVVLAPLAGAISVFLGHPVVMPTLDVSLLSTLLIGMLGLGGMRTVEKLNGAAGNH